MSMDARKFIAATVIVSAVLIGGFAGVTRFALGHLDEEVQAEEQRLGQLRQQLDAAAAAAAGELEHETESASAATSPTWQLLGGPEIVETLQSLQRLGDAAGVAFDEQKALNSSDAGKQSFTVSGRGEPTAVCNFFASIERSDRLMIVETGRIAPGGGDEIAFTIGLGTYHSGGRR